ncbi:MAG: hypothetical protein ABR928_05795 [Terracidiphilus sp.]|jgi:hypothetical protein
MDEKAQLRRFNLRCLLVAGMLLGGLPFIEAPLALHGIVAAYPTLFAAIFNGLSVLPASAYAFWRRRIACIWLSINAAVQIVCWAGLGHTGRQFDPVGIAGICGSIALALCLDFMEFRRWPAALRD